MQPAERMILRRIFEELQLSHLYEYFDVERIDLNNFLSLSDVQMERLGLKK